MFCQKCGKNLADDAKFCDGCGNKMGYTIKVDKLDNFGDKVKKGLGSAKDFTNENLKKIPINEKFKTPKMLGIVLGSIVLLFILIGIFTRTPSLEKVLEKRQGEEAIAYIQESVKEVGVNAMDYDGTTIMMTAASYGYADVVEALINEGADYNAEDSNSQTALSYAARNGHIDTVKVLLKEKKINIDAFNGRALRGASYYGWYDVVELLIKGGADVNAKSDGDEWGGRNFSTKCF